MLRWVALLSVGAIGLHQLRFLIGPGAGAHEFLSTRAHSYLPLVAALVALLFVASLVHFVSSLVLARSGETRPRRSLRFGSAFFLATSALLAIFFVQESLEGALVGGHSSGVHGLFGHGGWIVFALAPAIGALVAVLLRGAQSAIAAAARSAPRARRPRSMRGGWSFLPAPSAPKLDVLACHLAGRAPPVPSSQP
jgi:hypothetical protein